MITLIMIRGVGRSVKGGVSICMMVPYEAARVLRSYSAGVGCAGAIVETKDVFVEKNR